MSVPGSRATRSFLGWLFTSATLGIVLFGAGCRDPQPRAQRVVLVTVASLHLEAPPSEGEATRAAPPLFSRNRSRARFDNFYAATPMVAPSIASMMTGLPPWDHKVLSEEDVLRSDLFTVAELLEDMGFTTVAVLGDDALGEGLSQGFSDRVNVSGSSRDNAGRAITEAAVASLDDLTSASTNGENQLIWVHYGVTASQTPEIERLLTRLDRDEARYETHVVIAAAHGKDAGGSDGIGHGTGLSESQIRAPLFILSPRIDAQERHDIAGSIDIARTVLTLAGVKYPGSPWSNGRDLSAWAPDPELDPAARSGVRAAAFGMWPPGETATQRPVFYILDRAGRLYAGNGAGVLHAPDDARLDALEEVTTLFRALDTRP